MDLSFQLSLDAGRGLTHPFFRLILYSNIPLEVGDTLANCVMNCIFLLLDGIWNNGFLPNYLGLIGLPSFGVFLALS